MVDTSTALPAVTLAEAKAHLRVEHDADDAVIASMVLACTQMCEHEIHHGIIDRTDASGKAVDGFAASVEKVPQTLKQWVLLHTAVMYENRAAAAPTDLKPSPFLGALLDPFRWRE